MHYPKGGEIKLFPGIIKRVEENNYTFHHYCNTDFGSSGSPIINSFNYKVIGIHKGYKELRKINFGTLLKEPIQKFNEKFHMSKKNDIEEEFILTYRLPKDEYENYNDDDDYFEINETFELLTCEKLSELKIFGEKFVENNKDICKMIIDEQEKELSVYLDKPFEEIKIKLKNIHLIKNMSYIFCGCKSLISIGYNNNSGSSEILMNLNKVTNISYMFCGCENLKELPDMSRWNTSNICNMSFVFFRCKSLPEIPDISKWDTKNVTNMSFMFSGLSSLDYLPDISNWNTENVTDMSFLFSGKYFEFGSGEEEFNNNFINVLEEIFNKAYNIPNYSRINKNQYQNLQYLMSKNYVTELPDISKWNTKNLVNMSSLFCGCKRLYSLPDISKWNTKNVVNMCSLFAGCKRLGSLPDISI